LSWCTNTALAEMPAIGTRRQRITTATSSSTLFNERGVGVRGDMCVVGGRCHAVAP
jgi:hypothetical protein